MGTLGIAKRTVGVAYKTPLNEFTARLVNYDVQDRQGQFAKAGQQDVIFTFDQLKVLDTDEAYPYDALVIAIKYADAANSGWVILEDSILSLLGMKLEELESAGFHNAIDPILGATVTFKKEKEHSFGKSKTGQEFKGDVWRVASISGAKVATAANATDVILGLMENKSQAEVHALALANPEVRKDAVVLASVADGSFFKSAVVTAAFKVENGVFTKV